MIKILNEYIIVGIDVKKISVRLLEDESTTNIERSIANLSKTLIEESAKQMVQDISPEVSDICRNIGKG
jgi:hypothetical protein